MLRLKGIDGNKNVGCFYNTLGLSIFVLFFCFSARKFRYFFSIIQIFFFCVFACRGSAENACFFGSFLSVNSDYAKLQKTAALLVGGSAENAGFSGRFYP